MSRAYFLMIPLAMAACGDDNDSVTGEELVSGTASAALGAPTNQSRCATCHSTTGAAGFSGDTFKNIAFHTSFKGGDATTLLAAANACVAGWMGGTPLTEDDARWKSLEAYLVSISDPSVTTPHQLAPEVLANEAAYETAYAGGNASAGAAKYTLFCAGCHDNALVVGEVTAIGKANLKQMAIGRIAQQVRTSGPPPSGSEDSTDSTPGPMPFFEPDELSLQDLKDIIAYVRQ
jgi:cytochrome c